MAYTKTEWEDYPSDLTPINATNLNHIEEGIYDNDQAIADMQDHIVNISNEVDEDYRVNFLKNIKNLNNGINQNIYIDSSVGTCTIISGNTGLYISVSGGNYTISTTDTQTIYRVGLTSNKPSTTQQTLYRGVKKDNTSDSITIDTTGYSYLCITCTDLSKIQIEKGDSATSFETIITPSIYVDNEEIYSKIDYDMDLTDYKSSNVSTVARAMVHRTGKLYSFNCSVLVTSSGTNKQIFSQTPIKPDMTTNLMCINGNLQVSRAMIDINGNISIENAQTANIYYHLMGTIYVND